jgi:NADH dehydrogenase FAD-containing subunit
MTGHIAITYAVVIGGGYPGTLVANRLLKHPDLNVTLVNRQPVVSLHSST